MQDRGPRLYFFSVFFRPCMLQLSQRLHTALMRKKGIIFAGILIFLTGEICTLHTVCGVAMLYAAPRYGTWLVARAAQKALRQRADLGRHGGAEQKRLPFLRQARHHTFYIVHKAHVQHAVGLVQHEDLQLLQMDEPLVVEVHQPRVIPIDKFSVVISMVLAFVVLREAVTVQTVIGGLLITAGTLVLIL